MKFICDRQSLSEAMLNIQKAVPGKSNIPALEGVLIQTGEDSITLSGYDLEFGITTQIPAEIEETGTIVLPARLFSDIIRKLSDDSVTVTVDANLLTTVTTKQTEFTIIGIDAAEFPAIPQIDGEKTLSIDQASLKSMIEQTLYAVAQNDQKPVHTGIKFEAEEGILTLVAVDGYRLALRREPAPVSYTHLFRPGQLDAGGQQVDIFKGAVHCDLVKGGVTGHQLIGGLLAGALVDPQATGGVSLGINVHQKHPFSQLAQAGRQIDGGGGLPHPALLVGNGNGFSQGHSASSCSHFNKVCDHYSTAPPSKKPSSPFSLF